MKKIAKNFVVLSAATVLVACGGPKWAKTDYAGVRSAMENISTNFEANLDYDNLCLSTTTVSDLVEEIEGVRSRKDYVAYTIEIDVNGRKLHAKQATEEITDDKLDPTENEHNTSVTEMWISYDKEKGVVLQQFDGENKTYAITETPVQIEVAALAEEKTVDQYIHDEFAKVAYLQIPQDSLLGAAALVVSFEDVNELMDNTSDTSTLTQECYIAGEGDAKAKLVSTDAYDDGLVDGYDVDWTYTLTFEVVDYMPVSSMTDYEEVGEYYVTLEEKVPYSYSNKQEYKTQKNPKINIPSLKDFTLVE